MLNPLKTNQETNIKLPNKDGNSDIIEKRDHIKYFGVLLDEKLSWKHHKAYVCSRTSLNTIFSMLMIFIVVIRDMLVIKTFISRAQEPTLKNNRFECPHC